MDKYFKLFKALGDEKRLDIMSMLYEHGFCVGALAKSLGMSEAAVSQHIRILRDVGLLKGEKRGGYTFYEINFALINSLAEDIGELLNRKQKRNECCQYMTGEHQYCKIYIERKAKKPE